MNSHATSISNKSSAPKITTTPSMMPKKRYVPLKQREIASKADKAKKKRREQRVMQQKKNRFEVVKNKRRIFDPSVQPSLPFRRFNGNTGGDGIFHTATPRPMNNVVVKLTDHHKARPEDLGGNSTSVNVSVLKKHKNAASTLTENHLIYSRQQNHESVTSFEESIEIVPPEVMENRDEHRVDAKQDDVNSDNHEFTAVQPIWANIAPEQNKIVYEFDCKVCDFDMENQLFYKSNIRVNGRLRESGQMTLHMVGNEDCPNPHLKWNISVKSAIINTGLAAREGDIYMIGQNWATAGHLGEKRILVLRFRKKGEGNGGWNACGFEAAFRNLQKQLGVTYTAEDEYDNDDFEELTQASQYVEELLPLYDEEGNVLDY